MKNKRLASFGLEGLISLVGASVKKKQIENEYDEYLSEFRSLGVSSYILNLIIENVQKSQRDDELTATDCDMSFWIADVSPTSAAQDDYSLDDANEIIKQLQRQCEELKEQNISLTNYCNELRNKLTERRAPKAHVSTNGIESALDYNKKLKEQERKIAELEAEIKRQRRTKNDTLNSILGALQFTPSKQQRVVRMRKSLLEAGVRHQKGGNKKERTLALIGSVCLTIAILLYVVYAIFASPQMKFKIYEMFSI